MPGPVKADHDLPGLDAVRALAPGFAAAAQRIYDDWDQDADGMDAELGTGGICDLIADAIVAHVHESLEGDIRAASKPLNDEQHVNVSIAVQEGVFEIDIPHRLYEYGSMFTWTKRPDVRFSSEDVTFSCLSRDPGEWWMFVDDEVPESENVSAMASP